MDFGRIHDGVAVAQMMRGRRRENIANDTELFKLFKNGWHVKLSQLNKVVLPAIYRRHQALGKDLQRQAIQDGRA